MSTFEEAVQRGTRAAQPLATAVIIGTLYYVTDEGVTERSNGTTWDGFSDTGAATDSAAIHDNVAGEISAITEKLSPVNADLVIIEDSEAANVKKKVQVGNLPGGGGGAPTTADYLVKTADAGLSAERVVTDTTSITWDWATAGQAKAQRAALTGDVTASADSNATTIANTAVSNAKMANMATQTIKGRTTAGAGAPEDLTATQATAILDAMVGDAGAGGTKGLAPAPAAGDAAAGKFLKADATWATPAGGSNHNILSATHSDSTVGTVSRGDVITGQGASATWARLALGAAATLLRSDGTDAGWSLIGVPQIVVKAADETVNNSTTLQDDNELTIASLAAGQYVGFIVAAYDSSTTPDIKFGLNYSGTLSASRQFFFGLDTGATSTTGSLLVQSPGIGNARAFGGSGSGTFANSLLLFSYTSSTSGTLTLQWAQNAANASDTILKAGSFIILIQVS